MYYRSWSEKEFLFYSLVKLWVNEEKAIKMHTPMESLKKGSDLVGGRGGKLGSNQVPLRNKEFKLTVDYTRVV